MNASAPSFGKRLWDTCLEAFYRLFQGYNMVRKCVTLSLLVALTLIVSVGSAKGISVAKKIVVVNGISVAK